ncbi:MAG: hypothetical protein L6R48_16450 [Planctomycetes bacterium]|nr:hypothetical protein [Planctomycetota bacterium]
MAAAEPLRPFLDHIAPPRTALDLGGSWDCCLASDPVAPPTSAASTAWRPVVVPGDHGKLFQGPPDVRKQGRVWFRTRFTLSAEDAARAVDLHCERVNDTCLVVVNGVPVGETVEAWMPVRVALGTAVRPGANELLLGVAESRASGALGHRPQGIPWFHGRWRSRPTWRADPGWWRGRRCATRAPQRPRRCWRAAWGNPSASARSR